MQKLLLLDLLLQEHKQKDKEGREVSPTQKKKNDQKEKQFLNGGLKPRQRR